MWHLIVPPIVVVICFALILWYLSLRGSHPEIVRRVEIAGDEHVGVWRLAMRRFFLRVLEKLAQRSKVFSLRVHNTFHDFLQSVKEKRKMSDKQRVTTDSSAPSQNEPLFVEHLERSEADFSVNNEEVRVTEKQTIQYQEFSVESNPPQADFQVTVPLRRRSRSEGIIQEEQKVSIRPMVSDRIAHPEKPKKKSVSRPIEEDMIARIAVNPKDYTAYEALGDFYMERGDIQDAKECYRQVLKLSPVQRMVKIKIRRLEKLLSQKQG